MINYFLIYNSSRASLYGIGTYIKQMKTYISSTRNIHLFFIEMYADVKEYNKFTDSDGIHHYQIPPIEKYMNEFLYYRNAAYFLMLHINSTDKCIFHFNSFKQEIFSLYLKSYFINSRIIFTIHYFNWCFLLKGNYTKFVSFINNKINTEDEKHICKNVFYNYLADCSFLRKCDEIIVLSKFTKSILINNYKISYKKIHIIYNGLTSTFNNHKSFSYNNTINKNILFVGRLDEIKGISYIIKAFQRVVLNIPKITLILVGDGDFGKYLPLCENIRNKVIFTGKVAHDKLESIYQNATIGIQPSFHEQCSYSVIEMMKYGIPLIVSDSTGLKEMMEKCPENIVHINEQDFNEEDYINQIAKRMKKLLSDEPYRLQISDKMKEIYTERYTLEKMAESMDKLINITFSKKQPFISEEFLEDLDERMMSLINLRPDIELGFSGLSGIGHYLWWRVQQLKKQKSKESEYRKLWLEEHIIYFLDWLEVVLIHELNNEETFHSNDFQDIETLLIKIKVMHPTQVGMLLNLIYTQIPPGNNNVPPDKTIVSNAIKLYNTQQI